MEETNEKRAYAPGEKPDTKPGSPAGETWHYRDGNGEKLDPPAFLYARTNGKWGGEAGNLIFLEETRELVEEKVESELITQGYAVIPATKLEDMTEDRIHIESTAHPYFPTADVCISAPNVEIGVTVPVMDSDDEGGENLTLIRPGSVMLVGGDIRFCGYAGHQPTICLLVDHASGDTFSIPPDVSDQEVMALVQARRQYVRDNLRQGPPDAAPDNDEMVN